MKDSRTRYRKLQPNSAACPFDLSKGSSLVAYFRPFELAVGCLSLPKICGNTLRELPKLRMIRLVRSR